jgi:hypothetical protein
MIQQRRRAMAPAAGGGRRPGGLPLLPALLLALGAALCARGQATQQQRGQARALLGGPYPILQSAGPRPATPAARVCACVDGGVNNAKCFAGMTAYCESGSADMRACAAMSGWLNRQEQAAGEGPRGPAGWVGSGLGPN